jgi:hypothetical protein
MPLTTYTAGEVLTAASLNANFTFAAANPPGGLTLVTAQVIGSAVSSVAVTSAFSTTYDNYKIVISGGVASTSGAIGLKLGSTTTGYYYSGYNVTWTGTLNGNGTGNGSEFASVGHGNTAILTLNLELVNPFLADETMLYATKIDASTGGSTNMVNGYLNNQTSYTGFTLTPASGTLTGGTIYVYGYAKA